jgi:hypothetical protein
VPKPEGAATAATGEQATTIASNTATPRRGKRPRRLRRIIFGELHFCTG